MKKFFLLLFFLSMNAHAVELEGVKLADTAHLGNSNMVLNGVGVRSKFVFDMYVVALYLGTKRSSDAAVLADVGEKRIALHLLRNLNAEDLLWGLHTGIDNNLTDKELRDIKVQQEEFDMIFHRLRNVKKGDVILLDYLPDVGTQITLNGVLRGTIRGALFYKALLKIWLGDDPADNELKQKLLGGR